MPFPSREAADGAGAACGIRDCFREEKASACSKCRVAEAEGDEAPAVPADWVPDVEMLRRWALQGHTPDGAAFPPELPEEFCEPMGFHGGRSDDNKRAFDGIRIRARDPYAAAPGAPRVMCIMYTTAATHHSKVRAARETWAPGCDGFLAFSTASDPRIPSYRVDFSGQEEYHNIWQKVRSIWRFVAEHYVESFDFFIIGGDDILILPGNLRHYLAAFDPEGRHFLGRRFNQKGGDGLFYSGGAGYVLSRGTLRVLEQSLDEAACRPSRKTAMEDVMMAVCLRSKGIHVVDTRDDGRERFHPFAPGNHFTWRPSKDGSDWYERYNKDWGIGVAEECCSRDSVSFHYIKKPAMQRHLHKLLYGCGLYAAA